MKKLSLILAALLLIGSITACTDNPEPPANTDITTEAPSETTPEDDGSNKAYPSVADLVQVPDTPVTHPPIEPADYGTQPSEG